MVLIKMTTSSRYWHQVFFPGKDSKETPLIEDKLKRLKLVGEGEAALQVWAQSSSTCSCLDQWSSCADHLDFYSLVRKNMRVTTIQPPAMFTAMNISLTRLQHLHMLQPGPSHIDTILTGVATYMLRPGPSHIDVILTRLRHIYCNLV